VADFVQALRPGLAGPAADHARGREKLVGTFDGFPADQFDADEVTGQPSGLDGEIAAGRVTLRFLAASRPSWGLRSFFTGREPGDANVPFSEPSCSGDKRMFLSGVVGGIIGAHL